MYRALIDSGYTQCLVSQVVAITLGCQVREMAKPIRFKQVDGSLLDRAMKQYFQWFCFTMRYIPASRNFLVGGLMQMPQYNSHWEDVVHTIIHPSPQQAAQVTAKEPMDGWIHDLQAEFLTDHGSGEPTTSHPKGQFRKEGQQIICTAYAEPKSALAVP